MLSGETVAWGDFKWLARAGGRVVLAAKMTC